MLEQFCLLWCVSWNDVLNPFQWVLSLVSKICTHARDFEDFVRVFFFFVFFFFYVWCFLVCNCKNNDSLERFCLFFRVRAGMICWTCFNVFVFYPWFQKNVRIPGISRISCMYVFSLVFKCKNKYSLDRFCPFFRVSYVLEWSVEPVSMFLFFILGFKIMYAYPGFREFRDLQ